MDGAHRRRVIIGLAAVERERVELLCAVCVQSLAWELMSLLGC